MVTYQKMHSRLVAAALVAATLGLASAGHSQVTAQMAHPAVTQKFNVTAPGRWNQLYTYDYHTAVGSMGNLNVGSTRVPYTLRSSYDVATVYDNYTGIFIYDYAAAAWVEVFYAADGTDYVW